MRILLERSNMAIAASPVGSVGRLSRGPRWERSPRLAGVMRDYRSHSCQHRQLRDQLRDQMRAQLRAQTHETIGDRQCKSAKL